VKCFVINNFFTCPKEIILFQNGVFAISTVSTRWTLLWGWQAENWAASESQKVWVSSIYFWQLKFWLYFFAERLCQLRGYPPLVRICVSESTCCPETPRRKLKYSADSISRILSIQIDVFALSNVFRTDLFKTFHNQRNRIKSCCEVFIETLYKNNCQVDLGVF